MRDTLSRRSLLLSAIAKPKRRPNIVYVLMDQWRAQSFSYLGDKNARTPAIDALAAQSCDFQNAVSGLPVCSPYRATLMTGQYAVKHGLVVNDVELRPNGPTLGETFRKAGYATGYIGKWHIYGSPAGNAERRLTYIPESSRFGFDYWKTCECTHSYNRSLYYHGNDETGRYWDGYDAIAQTTDACQFIQSKAKAADPYFLIVSLGPPHDPYQSAPEKYRAPYANAEIHLRPNVPNTHVEEAIKNQRGYYAHISALDDCVNELGPVVAAIVGVAIVVVVVNIILAQHDELVMRFLSPLAFPFVLAAATAIICTRSLEGATRLDGSLCKQRFCAACAV